MKELIKTFYTGLSELDADKMISCYHEDVIFKDPVFGQLKGESAKKMWFWLCKHGTDLKVKFSDIKIHDQKGSAYWEARYTFGKNKRLILNRVTADFEFKDGKIIKHTDDFNLHRWASQAMGWKGKVLGGTSYFRKKLQHRSKKLLNSFEMS